MYYMICTMMIGYDFVYTCNNIFQEISTLTKFYVCPIKRYAIKICHNSQLWYDKMYKLFTIYTQNSKNGKLQMVCNVQYFASVLLIEIFHETNINSNKVFNFKLYSTYVL